MPNASQGHRRDGRPRAPLFLSAFFGAALLAAGAASGWFLATDRLPGRFRGAPAPSPGADGTPPGDRAASTPLGPVTDSETALVFRIRYPACGGEVVRTEAAGTARAGLGRADVERRHPGWRVEVFGPAEVILTRSQDGPCPDEAVYRTIGVRDGRVVVYAGRPGGRGPLLQDTGISVDRLLPADREKLSRGIEVRGEEGVWRLLEGLAQD